MTNIKPRRATLKCGASLTLAAAALLAGSAWAGTVVVAVGMNGGMVRTTDHGSAWSVVSSGTTNVLRDVVMADTSNGWAVGDAGTILHTSDGGATWGAQTSNTANNLRKVDFINAQEGWAVGDNATLLHTSDGGQTWAASSLGGSGTVSGVDFANSNRGVALALEGSAVTLLQTTNGGASWSSQTIVASNALVSYDVVLSSDGATVHAAVSSFPTYLSGFYRNSVAGEWNFSKVFSSAVSSVDFADDSVGWLLTSSGVYQTTDGGAAWTRQTNYGANVYGLGLDFANASEGWVVGHGGRIRYTANGGTDWVYQTSGTVTQLLAVSASALAPVPEPGTLALSAMGLLGLAASQRRRTGKA